MPREKKWDDGASWFEFLRLEADLAITFIGSARAHTNPANSARSLLNARRALAEIQHGVANPITCYLSGSEVFVLQQCCREIESALNAFPSLPPNVA